jgi:N-methylhydantoinase A
MDEVTGGEIRDELFSLEAQVRNSLAGDGVAAGAMTLLHFADLRYSGQAYELGVPVDPARPDLAAMAAAFDAEHARTYGHASPGAPTDLVSLKVIGRSPAGMNAASLTRLAPEGKPPDTTRSAYFGARLGRHDTPVIGRQALGATPRQGPMIIEDYDATCVVPPDATATLDASGNIDISIG